MVYERIGMKIQMAVMSSLSIWVRKDVWSWEVIQLCFLHAPCFGSYITHAERQLFMVMTTIGLGSFILRLHLPLGIWLPSSTPKQLQSVALNKISSGAMTQEHHLYQKGM